MTEMINPRLLEPGAKIGLADGSTAVVATNPSDGVWVFVRYLSSSSDSPLVGTEAMIVAQDAVEVLETPHPPRNAAAGILGRPRPAQEADDDLLGNTIARRLRLGRALPIEESVQQRNWLCGTPDDVISLLQEVEGKYPGLRHVIVSFAMGTPRAVYN